MATLSRKLTVCAHWFLYLWLIPLIDYSRVDVGLLLPTRFYPVLLNDSRSITVQFNVTADIQRMAEFSLRPCWNANKTLLPSSLYKICDNVLAQSYLESECNTAYTDDRGHRISRVNFWQARNDFVGGNILFTLNKEVWRKVPTEVYLPPRVVNRGIEDFGWMKAPPNISSCAYPSMLFCWLWIRMNESAQWRWCQNNLVFRIWWLVIFEWQRSFWCIKNEGGEPFNIKSRASLWRHGRRNFARLRRNSLPNDRVVWNENAKYIFRLLVHRV